ncbi:hypothetical protein AA0242T_0267 [Acetobacter aceti NRIC 0242]|nr:hypothetical protein AA0242T_0267 [Acetobacter aceti NRIC 0242]
MGDVGITRVAQLAFVRVTCNLERLLDERYIRVRIVSKNTLDQAIS